MQESGENHLYHFDSNKWMRYIKENGLVPHNGQNSQSIGDEKEVVFYSQGKEGAIVMYMDFIKHFDEYRREEGDRILSKYESANLNRGEMSDKEFKKLENQVKQVTQMRETDSLDGYLGKGPYLEIFGLDNKEVNDPNFHFSNMWTTETIPPEQLKVVALKEKAGDRVITDKNEIINYFLSQISPEEIRNFEINNPLKNFILDYQKEHSQELEQLSNQFDLTNISIQEYIDKHMSEPMSIKQISSTIIEELKDPEKVSSVEQDIKSQMNSERENEGIGLEG